MNEREEWEERQVTQCVTFVIKLGVAENTPGSQVQPPVLKNQLKQSS